MLLGGDIIDKLNRVWLTDQHVLVSDIDMTVVSDENSCVTTKILNNDVNNLKSPIGSGDDDEDETVVEPDEVNKNVVSAKSKNVADAEQLAL